MTGLPRKHSQSFGDNTLVLVLQTVPSRPSGSRTFVFLHQNRSVTSWCSYAYQQITVEVFHARFLSIQAMKGSVLFLT